MDTERTLGLTRDGRNVAHDRRAGIQAVTLRLAAMGFSTEVDERAEDLKRHAEDIFARVGEQQRLLRSHRCPADARIQTFLDSILDGLSLNGQPSLPSRTLVLDRHGLARELCLPMNGDSFQSSLISSYRVRNGVIHNPRADRRTTKGVFHVADIGLPVPADKIPVPAVAFGNMLVAALNPPAELRRLPFTSDWQEPVETFVSLLLRPVVCPAIPGRAPDKSMEVRFFAPGELVANLDFVESIFSNGGDPHLPKNDSALDVEHWTGHSGCVILAPHLLGMTKKELGLPHVDAASEREKAFGMCWSDEGEVYNNGSPYKITCRDERGVMVTIITDNYFGYCKKEVKTQISLSANLWGLAEEEHAGGALAFPSYRLGDEHRPGKFIARGGYSFADALAALADRVQVHDEGYATDVTFPQIHYVPEDASINLRSQSVTWRRNGQEQSIKLTPEHVYVIPSGYKLRMERHPHAPSWHLTGTNPEGVFCHKPATVSGGGKSEISKTLWNAILSGPIYVHDYAEDMEQVSAVLGRDYSDRMQPELRRDYSEVPSRPVLSPSRSLGSVIKLLTPSDDYTDEYNAWLASIPNHVLAQVFIIKRFYRSEWGDDWRSHFSVDVVNGFPGHELKLEGRKMAGTYLRVGLYDDGKWRTFKLRQDFSPTDKVQMEDDITASVVVPTQWLPNCGVGPERYPSVRLVSNCEWRLFQRPDDAIVPGFDADTERDMAGPGLFSSNFQPLTNEELEGLVEDVFLMDAFTAPMADLLTESASTGAEYSVCSAKPRIVDGKPTKNPRYLQVRPDVERPIDLHLAEVGARLNRRLKPEEAVVFPVGSVLSGRRNNPPDEGIRPLCVYNPMHYQELPELFMDYICSVTGKSPSTTGAGSEGALTKGPFNAIRATADLNNCLVAMLLTGYDGYSTAAGWIGPKVRVDHDVSLLVPEIWCRMSEEERDARWLIEHGYLAKIHDFEHNGTRVAASRLGYRITRRFVRDFLGRIFDNPDAVFTDDILEPERQDLDVFADGVNNIVGAQQWVAQAYLDDGAVEDACPPLQALLSIMATGDYKGMGIEHPDIRAMFTREALLSSDWYRTRLRVRQRHEIEMWKRHCAALREFMQRPGYEQVVERLGLYERLDYAERHLRTVSAPDYHRELSGTLGADPLGGVFV